jgi:hypothetical protein
MRKWWLVPIVLLLALGSIYWFIPSQLKIVQITPVHSPSPAVYRALAGRDSLAQHVRIVKKLLNSFEVQMGHIPGAITVLPLANDSCALQWTCQINAGSSPITRIKRYNQAVATKNNMAAILAHFKTWAEQINNLYGITLSERTFGDTTLIATKTNLPQFPGVKDIYSLLHDLKQYSAGFQAQATGFPLMNVTAQADGGYQLMTALPVDKPLPEKGIFFRRKIPLNKFLFVEVQGGDSSVQRSLRQLQLYITDHRKTVMALPFQVLVTDRSQVTDTSQWITHLYVPVF